MDKEPQSPDSLFRRILQLFGLSRGLDSAEELDQEIQELIDDGEEQGLISRQEGRMIHSILEFRDTVAREIMTPSSEIVSIEAATTYEQMVGLIIDKGFSRIPVYSGNPDNVVGVLYAKDLLRHMNDTPQPNAGQIVKPAYFALEDQKIINLLKDFQAKKVHLAIITDEFGSVRGLATLEDVLEEIVGEITDESDRPESGWKEIDEDTVIADGKIDIEDIEEFFDTDLPEGPYESVGGLIIHQLGHLPGVKTSIKVNGLEFQVIAATRRRISKVKISRTDLI